MLLFMFFHPYSAHALAQLFWRRGMLMRVLFVEPKMKVHANHATQHDDQFRHSCEV